jgi:hypothetical protein
MADRTLVQNYILDAQAAAPNDIPKQIAWLNSTHRVPLSAAVNGGDIEVTGRSLEGTSSQTRQRIDARTRLAAVIQAIQELTAASAGVAPKGRQGVLTPRFRGILP